jgi:hypothetical protein
VEAIERRTFFLALTVAILLAFDTPGFTSQYGRGWEITLYILGLVALAGAAALLAFAIAPIWLVSISRERRERLLFIAFALAMATLLQQSLLRAYQAYWAHKHGPSF